MGINEHEYTDFDYQHRTFSDNDTVTQPLFGEISADAGKRQTFASNVVHFMKLYGMSLLLLHYLFRPLSYCT